MASIPIYLLEVSYLDPATDQVGCIRVSSGVGFHTLPGDTPPNTYYSPHLATTCDYICSIFSDGLSGGAADGGYGEAKIANDDGDYDEYIGMYFDGQPVRLLRGPSGGSYSDFTVLLTGIQAAPLFTWQNVVIKVRDYTQFFDKPISNRVYMGNNIGNVGYEGTPDDLINQTKPTCWGRCLNVTPAAVSTENLIFQVHDGPIEEVEKVFIDGVVQSKGSDYATPDLLAASTVAEYTFNTCLSHGMFSIYGGVSSGVTAHVKGDKTGGTYVCTAGALLYRIATTRVNTSFWNLSLHNNDRTNAAWTKIGATAANGTYDSTPPVTDMVLQRIACDTSTGEHSCSQTLSELTGMYCYADYFKPDGCTKIKLVIFDPTNAANYVSAVFDIVNGVVSGITSSGTATGPQYEATGFITDANIIADKDGFFRCWVAGQPAESFTSVAYKVVLLNDAGSASFAGTTDLGILVGGAQLENYSSPHKYVGPTTTDPVEGHDPDLSNAPIVDRAPFDALDVLVPYEIGYYTSVGDTATLGDVMSAIADSVGMWWGFDRFGHMVAGIYDPTVLPAAAPIATFDVSNIIMGTLEQAAAFDSNDSTPAYRVSVSGNHNWTTVDKADVASSLWESDPDWVLWLGKESRDIRAEDLPTLTKHPLGCALSFPTYITSFVDCVTEAKRRLKIYSGDLRRFAFMTKLDYAQSVTIGSIVRLQHKRFGLSAGRNFYVVSVSETHTTGMVQLGVLG